MIAEFPLSATRSQMKAELKRLQECAKDGAAKKEQVANRKKNIEKNRKKTGYK